MKFIVAVFSTFFVCEIVQCANILAVIPTPFYSHQSTYRPIWRELAKRGHQITLITTDPMEQNDNITQLDYSGMYELFESHGFKDLMLKNSVWTMMAKMWETGGESLFKYQFTHPGFVELLRPNKAFDLLFFETWAPYYMPLSHKFKIPVIGLITMDAPPSYHAAMGNAMHPAIYPTVELGYENPLTFKQRLVSTAVTVGLKLFSKLLYSLSDKHIRKYVMEEFPDIPLMIRNTSLLFVIANPVFHPVRPTALTTVNLEGGLHLAEPKKLPKDLQTYLDQAKDGCIYFSLGSTVNSNALTPEHIEIFRKTFEELAPIKILWKYENDTLPNKPKNLEIRKWLPQQDVLRHPNIKLFITQGGLHSMEEAIDSAVPMLGMPFFGDQINNINKMVTKKFGIRLDVSTMDQKTLKSSILELLNNPLYRNNIQKLSKIQKDRPMTPLQKAVWWTEYVLRHGSTTHLRSPSADIPLYQYFFLDIIAFTTVVFVFIILIFYYSFKFLRFLFRRIFGYKCSKQNKEKVN